MFLSHHITTEESGNIGLDTRKGQWSTKEENREENMKNIERARIRIENGINSRIRGEFCEKFWLRIFQGRGNLSLENQ